MSDSTKAHLCLQRIVDLFKTGNVPKALAVVTIPPQAGKSYSNGFQLSLFHSNRNRVGEI